MRRARTLSPPQTSDLAGLPGAGIRRVASCVAPSHFLTGVIDPILADLHAEWSETPSAIRRGALYARCIAELAASLALLAGHEALASASRRALVWATSGCITLGLLLVMQTMIASSPVASAPPELRATPIASALPPPKLQPPRRILPPERPGESSTPGPPQTDLPPPSRRTPPTTPGMQPWPPPILGPTPRGIEGSLPELSSDDSCLPLVQLEPRYPDREARLGIEGSVLAELRINEAGQVVDTRILESTSPRFSREVRRAALRWRYRATTGSEPAQACDRVRVRLEFELP